MKKLSLNRFEYLQERRKFSIDKLFLFPFRGRGIKKAHPLNQMSFINRLKNIFEALNLTYLSQQYCWDGIGTFPSLCIDVNSNEERLSRLHRAITLCLS
jgi:hypothetical protein